VAYLQSVRAHGYVPEGLKSEILRDDPLLGDDNPIAHDEAAVIGTNDVIFRLKRSDVDVGYHGGRIQLAREGVGTASETHGVDGSDRWSQVVRPAVLEVSTSLLVGPKTPARDPLCGRRLGAVSLHRFRVGAGLMGSTPARSAVASGILIREV
jgi:hypothetical protein